MPILSEIVDRYVSNNNSHDMIIGGMDTDCAQLAPVNADIVDADVIADVEALEQQVRSGEVVVFTGPIYDNQGNEVVAEGQTLTEEDMFSVMYLVDNVIGTLD